MNFDYQNLFTFLKNNKSEKGSEFTNTSLDGGSFNIPDNEYDIFLKSYTQNLFNYPYNILSLTEKKIPELGILTVDLDFREVYLNSVSKDDIINIDTNNNNEINNIENNISRKYNLEQIITFCDKIAEYIDDFCVEDENISKYFIFERPHPRIDKEKVKDGIHIIFPFVCTSYNLYHYIRNEFIKNNLFNIFDSCNYSNCIEDIFDECVIDKNNWMMFNSSKKNTVPYKLTYTNYIDDDFDSIIEKEKTNQKLSIDEIYKCVSLFSIRNKNFETLIKEEKIEIIEDFVDNFKIKSTKKLSNNKNVQITTENVTSQEEDAIKKLIEDYSFAFKDNNNPYLIDNIKKKIYGVNNSIVYFVRLAHSDPDKKVRCPFKDEPHNRATCPIYFQINEDGLVMKCNDTGDQCNGKSYPMVPYKIPYTIKNIIFNNVTIVNNYIEGEPFFDNSIFENDKIEIFKNEDLNTLLVKGLSRTHYAMAKLLYYMFKEYYVYSGDTWYEFRNHRWIRTKNPSLKNKISEELHEYYDKLKKYYKKDEMNNKQKGEINNKQNTKENIDETDIHNLQNSEKIKIINSLINKLEDSPYKRNVMEQSQELFINEKFVERLDENRNIICFTNGIFDLIKMELRPGKLEDCACLCTNCEYIEYDEDNETYKELSEFIYRLLPNYEKREYMLKLIASCLEGHTSDERFHILTGSASNGKSKFTELINESLGDYGFSLPISLLTQKRQSANNANPEMAKTKGKRFGYLQEPDKGDEINVGYMKEITGGDPISTRRLFGEPFTFKPQFKLVLCCNDLPKIPSSDGGTWRRLRVIEFTSKFVDNPDPNKPNEFKKDISAASKIKYWRSAFCYMLIKYYKKYKKEGLVEPEEIMKYTKEYEMEHDKYQGFYDEYIKYDPNNTIKWADLLSNYGMWFKENKEDKMENAKEIKKRFEGLFNAKIKSVRNGTKTVKGWKGYRLIEFSADDEDDEED